MLWSVVILVILPGFKRTILKLWYSFLYQVSYRPICKLQFSCFYHVERFYINNFPVVVLLLYKVLFQVVIHVFLPGFVPTIFKLWFSFFHQDIYQQFSYCDSCYSTRYSANNFQVVILSSTRFYTIFTLWLSFFYNVLYQQFVSRLRQKIRIKFGW